MKFQYRAIAAAFALAAAAVPASADPMAAEYLVQRKALQKGTLPSTMLTFEVYSDSACTTMVDSAQVAASAVFIEQVKGLRLRGGVAPAKAVRLVAEIDVDAGAPFLRVTGTGIAPAGATCQLQGGSNTDISNLTSLTTMVTEVTQIAEATPLQPVVDIVLATTGGGQPDLDPDRVCFLVQNATDAVLSLITPVLNGGCSVDFDAVDGWMLTSELSGLLGASSQLCEATCLSWDDGDPVN
jgi:hypothetical protein